ncbi:MAG: alpha/beta fold hydrolase [Rhizobiaceae bacterium]|nr:alpha/beta fold hydrolase [Rhizobiaceae bacterium]
MAETLAGLVAAAFLIVSFVTGYFVLATRRIAAEAERRIPLAGRLVEIGGNSLHVVEAGQGRPILFLHGLGGQLHHFRHTLFDRLAGDFRLIAVDRPGSGYSTRAAGSSGRLTEQAKILAALIEELGLERPLIVGHSFGGAVALALGLDSPRKVAGLALISPLTHMRDSVPPEFRPLYIRSAWKRRILANTVAIPTALKYAPRTLDFVFGPQAAPKDYVVGGGGLLGLRPSHYEATVMDLVGIEADLGAMQARYAELDMPVGVLFGTADRVLRPEEHGQPLAGTVRDFELELLDGIGHMPQFVAADATEAFIRRMAAKAFFDAGRPPFSDEDAG